MLKKHVSEYKAYMKCFKTVQTCVTIHQSKAACNLVHNFGRMYGFDFLWAKLDALATDRSLGWLDEEAL